MTMLYPTIAKMEWLSLRGTIERRDTGNVRLHVCDSKGTRISTREFPSVAEAFAAFPEIAWDAYMDEYRYEHQNADPFMLVQTDHREDAP